MRLLCLAQFMMPPDPTQAPRAKQVYEIWKQKTYGRVTRGNGATPPKRANAGVMEEGVDTRAVADVDPEPGVLFDVDTFFAEEAEVEYDWAKELLGVWVGAAADNE